VPTRLVHLVIDAAEPARLARFWAAALNWEIAVTEPDVSGVWPHGYGYPDPAALPLVFVPVPEAKTGKNRVHLDVAPFRGDDHAAAVAALREAGAVPVDVGQGVQGDVSWSVLADPEGGEFCVLSPR
jgi:glyoxalase superfamily protein